MARDVVLQAYLYIFNNMDEVQPYLSCNKRLINEKFTQMCDKWLLKEHNKIFINWFNERISNYGSTSQSIKLTSYMPKFNVIT